MWSFIMFPFRIFTKIDFFPFPLSLYLSGSEKTKTFTGRLLTQCIIFYILYSFSTSDLVQKQNPEIFQQSIGLVNRPEIRLSSENFLLVIGLLGKENSFLVDPSVFKVILKTISQDNIGLTKNVTQLELGLCSADDFKNSSNVFLTRMESKAFCLRGRDLKLKGYWNEQNLDYLSFEVHKCINNSEAPLTCRSESEIDEILSFYSIQLYFTNNNVDLSLPENELSPALAAYSQQVDVNQLKILNIFLAYTELTTDNGFYFSHERKLSTIQESKVVFDMNSRDSTQKTLFAVNFFSDNCKNVILRKYQKIQDFLSSLTGVLHLVAFFGHFFAKLENRLNFIICVSNELFVFKRKSSDQEHQRIITKTINTTIPPIKLFDTNPSPLLPLQYAPTIQISKPQDQLEIMSPMAASNKQKNKFQSPESKKYEEFEPVPEEGIENVSELNLSKDISTLYLKTPELGKETSPINDVKKSGKQSFSTDNKFQRKSWQDGLKNLVNGKWKSLHMTQKTTNIQKNLQCYLKMKRKESRFDLGKFGYLRLLLKHKKWKLSETEQLYINGEKQVLNELDAVSILRKLQDVEKLKKVLLTHNQRYFFDLLSRPMIKLQEQGRKFSVEGERVNIEERYWKLREKARSSEVDERILKMLDEDVYSFMENSEGI